MYSSRDRMSNLHRDTPQHTHPHCHTHTHTNEHFYLLQSNVSESHRWQERQTLHGVRFVEQVCCHFLFALCLFVSSRAVVITLQLWRGGGIEGVCCTFSCRGSLSGSVSCNCQWRRWKREAASPPALNLFCLLNHSHSPLLCWFHGRNAEIMPFMPSHYTTLEILEN